MQPLLVELDPEELYNAAHGEAVHALGAAALMPLQYRPFCGGCTLDAGLYATLLAGLPPSLHTWKLVPMGLGALALGSLAAALWLRQGRAAGLAILLLAIATPPSWARLGLVAWGNHYEASALVLMALAAAVWADARNRHWIVVGLLLGAGCWVGLSAAFAAVAVVAFLALERRGRAATWLLPGLALGLAPALLRWGLTGESPISTIYEAGESVPALSRIPAKAATLLPPRQLAGLIGVRHALLGPVAGITTAASTVTAAALSLRRSGLRRLPAILAATWLAVYLVVRFQISVAPPGVVPTAGDVRYAAPVVIVSAVLVATVAATSWTEGRRLPAIALALPWLLSGLGLRAQALTAPFPVAAAEEMRAADFEYFREQASWAMPAGLRRAAAGSSDPRLVAVAAYATGRDDLLAAAAHPEQLDHARPLPPPAGASNAWAEGVAAALTDRVDPDADGDRASLLRANALLDELSVDWPAALQQSARRAICWRRVDGGAADATMAGAGDEEGLRHLLDAAARPKGDTTTAWRSALAWCAGRRWGRDRAPRWQPTMLQVPTGALTEAADETAFAAGLGRALGEAWGPAATDVTPRWNHLPSKEAYRSGVDEGSSRRWLATTR